MPGSLLVTHRINSSDEVTIRKSTTVIMWPVIPAPDRKQVVIGSYGRKREGGKERGKEGRNEGRGGGRDGEREEDRKRGKERGKEGGAVEGREENR